MTNQRTRSVEMVIIGAIGQTNIGLGLLVNPNSVFSIPAIPAIILLVVIQYLICGAYAWVA